MNTDIPQNTALLNRLILLVLSLILVCLVLLVVRAYMKPATGAEVIAVEPVPIEEPSPVIVEAPRPIRPPPARPPATNVVRVAPAAAPISDSTFTPPPEPPDAGAVHIPSVIGTGVPRISIGGGEGGSVTSAGNNAEISGIVTLDGTPKPEMAIALNPACGRLNPRPMTTRHYVMSPEGGLANVFVHISKGINRRYAPPQTPVLLDQTGCVFEPYVFGMQVGQTLQIRNSDPEMHNIHTTPRVNPERNFAQLGGQVNNITFDKPEILLRVKCDVHPWMFAYPCVVDHPFYSVTDTNGVFRLPNGLRAGKYTLTASHLRAGTRTQEFEFRPGRHYTVKIVFTPPDDPQARNNGAMSAR